MSPTWVAFLLGAIVWVPMGVLLSALCVAAARGDIEREMQAEYTRGLEKGRALAHANAMHDIIANDTASAFGREGD